MPQKLGKSPIERYYLSYITQRIANNAPETSFARNCPSSILKQIVNPQAIALQETELSLVEERDNVFLSSTNIDLLDHLFFVELKPSIAYEYDERDDGSRNYHEPKVFTTIGGVEYELSQAKENRIEYLHYKALPSRIEDGNVDKDYEPIIYSVQAQNIINEELNTPSLEGHLYITIEDNKNWELRRNQNIYKAKAHIEGTTRKGLVVKEVVPLMYNGTFKSINQWKEIKEIFFSYLSSTAMITVDTLAWHSTGILDKRNLCLGADGQQKWRWLNVNKHEDWDTIITEAYTTSDFNLIRKDFSVKEIEHEIEPLDEDGNPLTIDAFTVKPFTDYAFVLANNKLYVYNYLLPYPNMKTVEQPSPSSKVALYADKWVFARNEIGRVKTRMLSFSDSPNKIRWIVKSPDGSTVTEDWQDVFGLPWLEKTKNITMGQNGIYDISFQCFYFDEETNVSKILTSKYIFYVPSIEPEIVLTFPETIPTVEDMAFDSDGKLWALSDNKIYLLNLYYDYFIADYERNLLWVKEDYEEIRIEV